MKQTNYIGGFIYEQEGTSPEKLALIQHEEGRILPDTENGGYEYQYHLKDHLGNVRVTFTSKPKVETYLATLEDTNLTQEQAHFSPSYDQVTKISNSTYNHTAGGNKSIRLSGSQNEIIGLSKSLQVAVVNKCG
ncbi:hypothetical protein BH23BAC1_BH23BAC1_43220 [soil metagenome]